MRRALAVAAALGASSAALLALAGMRVARTERPLTERWRDVPVEPRGRTRLGVSFRPLQAEALGLDPRATLDTLLRRPFPLLRLGAYWNRLEPEPDRFCPEDLDWQLDAADRAGRRVILCVGAVKTFGYPEFFVPPHHLVRPLPEGSIVDGRSHGPLLEAAMAFVTRVVERYRDRPSIMAWQVEHEAVDPLGIEHSWRLGAGFVRAEVEAVRGADPSRPVLMNGFLPTSLPVRLQQWWRTRDQGDSLAVAGELADIVGIDVYPRHALVGAAGRTLYLEGGRRAWGRRPFAGGRPLMVTEGQAEPWEAVTTPPNPEGRAPSSCPPERLIENYNRCLRWAREAGRPLDAYLFWGAEYWVLRERCGDPAYLRAFERLLE